jgi:DNA mismatch repair protein MutS
MPAAVVKHARQALEALEAQQTQTRAQVDLFAPPPAAESPMASAVESALTALDPDAMSPREALEALYSLKKLQLRDPG